MTYRITATLGRSTTDYDELRDQARQLGNELEGGQVVVDAVKAVIQVTFEVATENALYALGAGVQHLNEAFGVTGLKPPVSIAHLEAEHVPPAAEGHTGPIAASS